MHYTNQGQYVVCVVQRGSRNSRLRGERVALSLAVFHCLWCDSMGRNCQKIERKKKPFVPPWERGGGLPTSLHGGSLFLHCLNWSRPRMRGEKGIIPFNWVYFESYTEIQGYTQMDCMLKTFTRISNQS